MVSVVPSILARIVDHKRTELADVSRNRAELERRAGERPRARDFKRALTDRRVAIIAEIKQASPSQGKFTKSFDPSGIAKTYSSGGAAALSVLTDREFFQGDRVCYKRHKSRSTLDGATCREGGEEWCNR